MASGKVSPRQKMINMMYLVLTAMLALNVSAEILKAFNLVNRSLAKSSDLVGNEVSDIQKRFSKEVDKQGDKARPWQQKSEKAKVIADQLYAYLDELKIEIIDEGGNKNKKLDADDLHDAPEPGQASSQKDMLNDRTKGEANLDISSHVMIGDNEGKKNGKGYVLMQKIKDARTQLLALVDKKDIDDHAITLALEDPIDPPKEKGALTKTDWVQSNFGHMPLAAAITMLTKFQTDVRNTEAEMMRYFINKIGADDIKFDNVVAKVIAPTSYLLQGQEYKAEIILAAYDSKRDLDIRLNGAKVPVKDGVGEYKTGSGGVGEHKYSGFINVPDPKEPSGVRSVKFDGTYTVAAPAATISPDKMNVFYIGVDNPVSISAAGVQTKDLQVSIDGGQLSGTNGHYVVKPNNTPGKKATIHVRGKVGDKVMDLGSAEYRIKRIPDPIIQVGSLTPGSVRAGTFKAQGGVVAILKDFDFEAKFKVLSYKVFYIKARQDPKSSDNTGASWSGTASGYVSSAAPGDKFIIDNVKVQGPDGAVRTLPPIPYQIN